MLERKILIQDIANDNVCKLSTLEIYQLDEIKGLEKTPQPVNIILPSGSLFNRAENCD